MRYSVGFAVVMAVVALSGCSESTPAECTPGSEGCECNMGKCLAGLVCLSNLCVDPGTGGTGGTAGTGGTVGTGGGGGTGGGVTCDAPACILCPAEALGPQGGIIGDLLTPVDFTATAEGPVVQGETATIFIEGSSSISVPVPVMATILGDNTTYVATSGGEGTLELEIPEQDLMGTELDLEAGEGSGPFDVDADATELVIGLQSALIEIQVTEPAALALTLDASDSGDCEILGEGVSIEVSGAGGAGGAGGCVYDAPEQDAITCINGEAPPTDAGTVYFSAENCADAANTLYDLTLTNGDGVSQVWLWAGIEDAGCELVSNRLDQLGVCRAVADNPRTVGHSATVFDLTLQDLVETGIVDCAVLEGQHYEIYSFRNEDPGGNDIGVEGYGVAPFKVGVTLP